MNEWLQRAIPRNGMEWNGTERNSMSVLQNISFHHIGAMPRNTESNLYDDDDDDDIAGDIVVIVVVILDPRTPRTGLQGR